MKLFWIIILIGSIYALGFLFLMSFVFFEYDKITSEEDVRYVEECRNLSLTDTSNCLRNYISTFYNYTIRKDTIKTLKDIKQNGGDCYDYNFLYSRLGKDLGFYTYTFNIKSEKKNHRVAFIMDNTGYCLLDQLHEVNCFYFEKEYIHKFT